jgi:hypothetical protein
LYKINTAKIYKENNEGGRVELRGRGKLGGGGRGWITGEIG